MYFKNHKTILLEGAFRDSLVQSLHCTSEKTDTDWKRGLEQTQLLPDIPQPRALNSSQNTVKFSEENLGNYIPIHSKLLWGGRGGVCTNSVTENNLTG